MAKDTFNQHLCIWTLKVNINLCYISDSLWQSLKMYQFFELLSFAMAFFCNLSVSFFENSKREDFIFLYHCVGKNLSFWWCGFYEAKLAMFIFLCLLSIMFMWEICLRVFFLLYFTFPLVSFVDFPLLLLTIFPIPKSVIQNLNIVMKSADLQFFSSPLIFIDRTFSTFLSGKKSCFQYADN